MADRRSGLPRPWDHLRHCLPGGGLIGIPGHFEEAHCIAVEGGYGPTIRFEDKSGLDVQFRGAFIEAEEGQSFTVLYDPADPAATAITDEGHSESVQFGAGFAVSLGTVAVLLGAVAFYRYRHPKRT